MSGPKVVNIAAVRANLRRLCAVQIDEIRLAMEQCSALGTREELANIQSSLHELVARFETEQNGRAMGVLAAEVTVLRNFCKLEVHRIREEETQSLINNQRTEFYLKKSSEELARALEALPESTKRDQLLSDLNQPDGKLQDAVTATLAFLAEIRTTPEAPDRLNELAAQFAAQETSGEVHMPIPAIPKEELDRFEKCWSFLAQLESEGWEEIGAWKERLHRIEKADDSERSLLMDSLILDLGERNKAHRIIQAAHQELLDAMASLAPFDSEQTNQLRAQIRKAIADKIAPDIALTFAEAVRKWAAKETAICESNERREAILEALTHLGYEVREGMATAWTEEGKVVVQKPSDSVYGVEFMSPATGSTLQVRVVANHGTGRSPIRDREAEETWCSEFEKLQELLGDNGFESELKMASPAGAIPIKTIATDSSTRIEKTIKLSEKKLP